MTTSTRLSQIENNKKSHFCLLNCNYADIKKWIQMEIDSKSGSRGFRCDISTKNGLKRLTIIK
jgi:hypothetical protein